MDHERLSNSCLKKIIIVGWLHANKSRYANPNIERLQLEAGGSDRKCPKLKFSEIVGVSLRSAHMTQKKNT